MKSKFQDYFLLPSKIVVIGLGLLFFACGILLGSFVYQSIGGQFIESSFLALKKARYVWDGMVKGVGDEEGILVHVVGTPSYDLELEDKDFGVSARGLWLRRVLEVYDPQVGWVPRESISLGSDSGKIELKSQTLYVGDSELTGVTLAGLDLKSDLILKIEKNRGKLVPAYVVSDLPSLPPSPTKEGEGEGEGDLVIEPTESKTVSVLGVDWSKFGGKLYFRPSYTLGPKPKGLELGGGSTQKRVSQENSKLKNPSPSGDGTWVSDGWDPTVGDVRVSFYSYSPTSLSVLARRGKAEYTPYEVQDGSYLYMVSSGKFEATDFLDHLSRSFSRETWVERVLASALAIFGLLLILYDRRRSQNWEKEFDKAI